MSEEKLIAKVEKVFTKIEVAALDLSGEIEVGDTIRFSGPNTDFYQMVSSMEKNHQKINSAKPGDDIAVKVDKPVVKGDLVFKVFEDEN